MSIPIRVGQVVHTMVEVGQQRFPTEATVLAVEGDTFEIDPPQRYGVVIPVKSDALVVTLSVRDEAFQMECPLLQVTDEKLMLAVPPDEDIRRIPRRRYTRILRDLPCQVELDFENNGELWPPAPAHIKDISAGGCAFLFVMELTKGMRLVLNCELPGFGKLCLPGMVKQCFPVVSSTGLPFQVGIEFEELEDELRADLGRYVESVVAQDPQAGHIPYR